MLVSYEHVSKRYGAVVALRDVSFQLSAGEAVAFCGPNGAGKSTCLRLAIGLIQPTEGRVTVLGGDPSRDWAMKRSIGYAGDSRDLIQELTVEELLYYVGNTRAQSSSMDAEIGRLLDTFQLTSKRGEPIRNLSDGMRKKVLLVQALIGSPRLLILDEPTSGLDLEAQSRCAALLTERMRNGTSLLMGTHDLRFLSHMRPRMIGLSEGSILADGGHADLLTKYGCDGTEELFSKLWTGSLLGATPPASSNC